MLACGFGPLRETCLAGGPGLMAFDGIPGRVPGATENLTLFWGMGISRDFSKSYNCHYLSYLVFPVCLCVRIDFKHFGRRAVTESHPTLT